MAWIMITSHDDADDDESNDDDINDVEFAFIGGASVRAPLPTQQGGKEVLQFELIF